MSRRARTLVLGWGNSARGDDGLGPEFVRTLGRLGLPGVETDSDYQLQVENAADIAGYHEVLFVDADRDGPEPFRLDRLRPRARGLSFSTHSVTPTAVLALCRDLFQAEPEAWLLGIRGYVFDRFEEQLSGGAQGNLDAAVAAVETALRAGDLQSLGRATAGQETLLQHEDEKCLTTNP